MSSRDAVVEATALYYEATAHFDRGDLHACRETAEVALQALAADRRSSDRCGAGHSLFAELLMLLSSVYLAAGSYVEAERLLTTAAGYVQEHLGPTHLGLAAIAYNRAILLLDQHRSEGREPAGTHDISWVTVARDVYLAEAEERLMDVLGVPRLLLADALHSKGVCEYILNDFVAALDSFRRSLEIRVRFGDDAGVTELKLALTLEHVAHIQRLIGSRPVRAEALRVLGAVGQARRQYLGPRHPLYGQSLYEQGVLAAELGRTQQARAALVLGAEVARDNGDKERVASIDCWLRTVS